MALPASTGRHEAEAVALSVPGERYDRVVRLAQAIFGAPIAALNLIGQDSQFTVASVGYPKGETPVEDSICRVTVQHDEVLEVRDLREDERFATIPAVVGPRASASTRASRSADRAGRTSARCASSTWCRAPWAGSSARCWPTWGLCSSASSPCRRRWIWQVRCSS
ncbi:hypothetical protein D7I44_00015 [Gryllotalpicola protaetiae]|uniref:GAF domain-containing protein n=1 Tax=Gryllotalpicola protaetiae TaxID=2419771 RepID=A0A387BLJ4_9MICO|nr:hypothetical protein D7I44_00015 [Gryllotalpicola protaetiae]